MGMPCEVNSILKLNSEQGYPVKLCLDEESVCLKKGYRILPIDVPIPLVDSNWMFTADIIITRLVWEHQMTEIKFKLIRILDSPLPLK
jgi:hypothetical protein